MRSIYYILVVTIVTSCSQAHILQNSLNKISAPLGYLYDSKIENGPKQDTVTLQMHIPPLDSITRVWKTSGKFLPLVFIYYHEVNMKVKLGQRSIQQDYNGFFNNSFIDESDRSGCYYISNDKNADTSRYTLNISIDSCLTTSRYEISSTLVYFFMAYSMNFQQTGYPAETHLKIRFKLSKGNRLIGQKSYDVLKNIPFLRQGNNDQRKLRQDFATNMVESLSLGTKECIETMVQDINTLIRNQTAEPVKSQESIKASASAQSDSVSVSQLPKD